MEGQKQEGQGGTARKREALGLVPAYPPAQTLTKSHHSKQVASHLQSLADVFLLSLCCTYTVCALLGATRNFIIFAAKVY